MTYMETIGQRVRRLRVEKGLKSKDLAKLADLSPSALSDLERDRTKRTLSLHRLAAALDTNVTYLETGSGDRFARTPGNGDAVWAAIRALEEVQGLVVLALAESIPTVGWALVGALERVQDNPDAADYPRQLRTQLVRRMAATDIAAARRK